MKPTLNLASRTYLNRQLLYATYGLIALVLTISLAGSGYYMWTCRQDAAEIGIESTQIKRQLAELDSGSSEEIPPAALQKQQKRIAFANMILRKDAFRWTDLLDKLEDVLPEGVALRSIQPEYRDGSLRINGLARNLDKLQAFLDNLLVSPAFGSAFLLHQERLDPKEGLGRDALSFSIHLKGAF
jgi:type IV pilus assembly protein PilN